ncbi:Protein of unknown function [Pyronema omphalodes CBS 100304]|uniref:Uncharacterized protein n=1 Tax=Pyronema omphalodes (strain CBS 100304) TaxID=1076935 RepID=U4LGE4_PYROM|nr:Protein of unknown function [Pyronema omphalodes CBS 100304]
MILRRLSLVCTRPSKTSPSATFYCSDHVNTRVHAQNANTACNSSIQIGLR